MNFYLPLFPLSKRKSFAIKYLDWTSTSLFPEMCCVDSVMSPITSYGSDNKLPQSYWLKTQIYYNFGGHNSSMSLLALAELVPMWRLRGDLVSWPCAAA
jgi:hypothetical protein